MKRRLLALINAVLSPFGVQLSSTKRPISGMELAVKITAEMAPDIKTVLDIGAASGNWSRMAMKYFSKAKFVGIEPLAEREPELKALKDADARFDYALCVAGQNENELVELTVSDDLDGSTVGAKGANTRAVPSRSVDAIVKTKGCQGPFLIKFDTHGFEVPILKGAQKTLENTSYIIMEVYNYRHTESTLLYYEMCEHLNSLGFRCFNLADPMQRPVDNSLWQMDLFFARKDNPVFRSNSYDGR